ncbi:unnamed protein product [Clonostachys rosea f. rosea IK726]|uniref:Signal peptidase complex subunit 2 n=2 Tax=Bionectria ochroleuca TaxID=29856 RepID=A0A0B7JZU5_BIOOC|nr:unnamed protein product [Clonostachys rosea f. rosea IK726]
MADKITLYNLPDLKNAADDAIANYLNSIKFKQSHSMIDVRLALGYSSFLLAAACALWDYQFGWEATKLYTAVAVAIYTVLSGALTLWTWKVEQGTIYQGKAPSGDDLFIASETKKMEPVYRLKIAIQDKSTGKIKAFKISKPFSEFFDETGLFVPKPFQEFLATNISVVGKADSKRIQAASEKLLSENPELLSAVLNAGSEKEAEATGTEKKAGGKRRKA